MSIGITRPEMMAVLALLAAMSVIAMPEAFLGARDTPLPSQETDRRILETAMNLYYVEHGAWPESSRELIEEIGRYLPQENSNRLVQSLAEGGLAYVESSQDSETTDWQAAWAFDRDTRRLRRLGIHREHQTP